MLTLSGNEHPKAAPVFTQALEKLNLVQSTQWGVVQGPWEFGAFPTKACLGTAIEIIAESQALTSKQPP